MGWSNMPLWFKLGVYFTIGYLFLFMMALLFDLIYAFKFFNFIFSTGLVFLISPSIITAYFFDYHLIDLNFNQKILLVIANFIIYFVLGSVIGWIYEKIKLRNINT